MRELNFEFLYIEDFMNIAMSFILKILSMFLSQVPIACYHGNTHTVYILLDSKITERFFFSSLVHEYTHALLFELEGLTISRQYDNISDSIEDYIGITDFSSEELKGFFQTKRDFPLNNVVGHSESLMRELGF